MTNDEVSNLVDKDRNFRIELLFAIELEHVAAMKKIVSKRLRLNISRDVCVLCDDIVSSAGVYDYDKQEWVVNIGLIIPSTYYTISKAYNKVRDVLQSYGIQSKSFKSIYNSCITKCNKKNGKAKVKVEAKSKH